MKKITTFLMMLLAVAFGFSQNVPIDFEADGNGANWTWTVFENTATPPALEIISNPVSEGINTSATVAKYTILQGGGGFAGLESQKGADIGTWTVTDQNAFVKVMVRQVGFTGTVGLKFANNAGASLPEVRRDVPAGDEWVELSFDMSAWIGNGNNPVNQIIFFVDIDGDRSQERIVYLDNVTFNAVPAPTCDDGIQNGNETGVDCGGSCDACPPPPMPTTAAPQPTLAAADVTSIFSDFYGPNTASGANNAQWEKKPPSNYATYSSVTLAGSSPADYFHYYSGANTVYISWDAVDTSERGFLNFSVWSANATFGVFLIQSANSPAQGTANVTLIPNQWNQVEIPIPTESDVYFQFVADALGNKDIYLDNIYFSKVSTLSNDAFSKAEFKAYPNPTTDVWNIKTTENMKNVQIFNITGRLVKDIKVNSSDAVIDTNGLSRGVYLAKISNEADQTRTIKLIKE